MGVRRADSLLGRRRSITGPSHRGVSRGRGCNLCIAACPVARTSELLTLCELLWVRSRKIVGGACWQQHGGHEDQQHAGSHVGAAGSYALNTPQHVAVRCSSWGSCRRWQTRCKHPRPPNVGASGFSVVGQYRPLRVCRALSKHSFQRQSICCATSIAPVRDVGFWLLPVQHSDSLWSSQCGSFRSWLSCLHLAVVQFASTVQGPEQPGCMRLPRLPTSRSITPMAPSQHTCGPGEPDPARPAAAAGPGPPRCGLRPRLRALNVSEQRHAGGIASCI